MKKVIICVILGLICLISIYGIYSNRSIDILDDESSWKKYCDNEYSEGTNVEITGIVFDEGVVKDNYKYYTFCGPIGSEKIYTCDIRVDKNKNYTNNMALKIKGKLKYDTDKEGKRKLFVVAEDIDVITKIK